MHASDQAPDPPFPADPVERDPHRDDRILNILQVLFIAFGLALVSGIVARTVGFGWGVTVLVSWASSVFGTLALVFVIFVVREAMTPFGDDVPASDVPGDDDPVPDVFGHETGRTIDARLTRFWGENASDGTTAGHDARGAHQEDRRRS